MGNAANRTPPPTTSQTSLPSQIGPMLLSDTRRSSSVCAAKGCRIPTPMSNPSRITYPAMIATNSPNQRSARDRLLHLLRVRAWLTRAPEQLTNGVRERVGPILAADPLRTVLDLAVEQENEQDEQQRVQQGEHDHRGK